MNNYYINLHAHTIFSDGVNSPLGLALLAKELDNENDLIRYIRSGKQPTFVIDID